MRVQTEAEASLTLSLASKSLNGCLYLYLYFMFAILISRYCSYIESEVIPDICHFFTRAKFLENKIYTEKTRKLRQKTQ